MKKLFLFSALSLLIAPAAFAQDEVVPLETTCTLETGDEESYITFTVTNASTVSSKLVLNGEEIPALTKQYIPRFGRHTNKTLAGSHQKPGSPLRVDVFIAYPKEDMKVSPYGIVLWNGDRNVALPIEKDSCR